MTDEVMIDAAALRNQVQEKYREVATNPSKLYHFHTGRYLAALLGYDAAVVAELPDAAVESFAGVANPFFPEAFSLWRASVDIGSGGGFDSFIGSR
jgi:hypothetical protein